MGADGHVILIAASDWRERFPDVEPARFGLYERKVLGVDAIVYYWDTENHDPPWSFGPPHVRNSDSASGWQQGAPWTEREREVLEVLKADGIGEDLTVWT